MDSSFDNVLNYNDKKCLNKFLKQVKNFNIDDILNKLLKLDNKSLLVDYVDYNIQNGSIIHLINSENFYEVFKIYIINSTKDNFEFIYKYVELFKSDILNFILEYYIKDKQKFLRLVTNKTILKINSKYVDFIKSSICELIISNHYKEAIRILDILIETSLVDLDFVENIEDMIINYSKKDHMYNLFVINYFNSKIYKSHKDKMLNDILPFLDSNEALKVAKILLLKNDYYFAYQVLKKLNLSMDTKDIDGYIKILKLDFPLAILLEKMPYLDKRIILNIIVKDEIKLFVYGEEILSGYNFDNHIKNKYLDIKYFKIKKLNKRINPLYLEENSKKMKIMINRVSIYNDFFRKRC